MVLALDLARARAVTGWMADAELRWLARAARSCRIVVEVGCYQGRSTRALADHCPGVVYAVDPWEKMARTFTTFQTNLLDHIASGRVVPIQATLEQAMPRLEHLGLTKRVWPLGSRVGQVDLVFIDDSHAYETTRRNIELARRLLRPGGILAGHDYGKASWPDVKRAVDEAFPRVDLLDSIWWVMT